MTTAHPNTTSRRGPSGDAGASYGQGFERRQGFLRLGLGKARAKRVGSLLVSLVALAGCQAPDGLTDYAYGSAPACSSLTNQPAMPHSLQDSLAPLKAAFDEHSEVPRLVALMPHMGCERGAEILRTEVLGAHPDRELALFVIWQDEARTGGAAAAARATAYLEDPRVTAFHDCSGIAGRAFARGNLPVAEAREVFLFYPAGLRWPSDGSQPMQARPVANERPPRTDSWVHQLGRVAPERFCTPEELPRAIRRTVQRLLDDADVRRARLEEAERVKAHRESQGALVSGLGSGPGSGPGSGLGSGPSRPAGSR